jgi:regulatory protein
MERKITALKTQKRNHQRVNVHLDGEFAFGLSMITAAWLEIGQVLGDDKIRQLQEADEIEIAYQKSLNYLSYRSRSEKEVSDNLRKHKFSNEVIQDVIDRLRRNQLVDDHDFARIWVENRSDFRPRGRRALSVELHRKGIQKDIIDEVLQDLDEDELAFQAAIKQSRKYQGLDWEGFRKKMVAFLARRGFGYGVAAPIVKKIWSEVNSSPDSYYFEG